MVPAQIALNVAAITSKGPRRSENQDTVTVDDVLLTGNMAEPFVCRLPLDEPRLFMIADGMGGHAAGAIASRTASIFLRTHKREFTDQEICKHLLASCNQSIYAAMEHDERYSGMGTTIVGISVIIDKMVLFNVGDSRCYRLSDGRFSLLSLDDVLLSSSQLHDQRTRVPGVITQALGGHSRLSQISPHVHNIQFGAAERFVLCSDGLSDEVSDNIIHQVMLSEKDAHKCVSRLFKEAITRGGRDNISILAIDTVLAGAAVV